MFTVVAFELFYGQPVGIGDVSIALDDRDDPGTIVFTQEFGCVVSDIAKSLTTTDMVRKSRRPSMPFSWASRR